MCKRNKWLSRAGAALCAVLMLTAFSGCNGNGGDAGDQIITPSTDSTGEATDAVTEPTEAPTEAETTTTTAASVTSDVGYVNATTMHIRSGPGTDYGAIGGLKMGDQVKILGKEGDWYNSEFQETGGYVSAQFIQGSPVTVTTTAPADDIPTPTTASVPQE